MSSQDLSIQWGRKVYSINITIYYTLTTPKKLVTLTIKNNYVELCINYQARTNIHSTITSIHYSI